MHIIVTTKFTEIPGGCLISPLGWVDVIFLSFFHRNCDYSGGSMHLHVLKGSCTGARSIAKGTLHVWSGRSSYCARAEVQLAAQVGESPFARLRFKMVK
jgi:hypothetical protein